MLEKRELKKMVITDFMFSFVMLMYVFGGFVSLVTIILNFPQENTEKKRAIRMILLAIFLMTFGEIFFIVN